MDDIRWPTFIIVTVALCTALFLAIFLSGGPASTTAAVGIDSNRASFGICFGPDRYSCVVDGDTIWFEGRKILVAEGLAERWQGYRRNWC